MSLSVTLHVKNGIEPQYFFGVYEDEGKERFAELTRFLSSGPCSLGHGSMSADKREFHVHKMRTHYFEDADGSRLGGNAELPDAFGESIENGYDITSFADSEAEDAIDVKLEKDGRVVEVSLPNGDRHAPIIDGLCFTLRVATRLFKEVNFYVTEKAKTTLGSLVNLGLDASELEDRPKLADQDPTYCYASRLTTITTQLNSTKLVIHRWDADETAVNGAERAHVYLYFHAQQYSGIEVWNQLREQYVEDQGRRPLPKVYDVKLETFLSYYTPLDQGLERCNAFAPGDNAEPVVRRNPTANGRWMVAGGVALLAIAAVALHRANRTIPPKQALGFA